MIKQLSHCTGFQWDEGKSTKNWDKHRVSRVECEQLFFNKPLIVKGDAAHSEVETRFYSLGKTDRERKLFIVFTVRGDLSATSQPET